MHGIRKSLKLSPFVEMVKNHIFRRGVVCMETKSIKLSPFVEMVKNSSSRWKVVCMETGSH